MLQQIRDSKGLGRNILIGLSILVLSVWGLESIVGTLLNETTVVEVNGTEITESAVENAFQQRYSAMLQDLGPDGDLSSIDEDLVRELSINELIQRELLNQVASDNNMQLSRSTIARLIASTEAFQIDGVYSDEMARTMLSNAGFTLDSYAAALAGDETINQITMAYAASGFTTQAEKERFAALAEQTRNVRYLLLDYFDQSMTMTVTEEEVAEYYDNNQDEFIREEQVVVDYLMLSRIELMDEIEVSEEQIAARYEENRENFQSQIERRASHILLEASSEEMDAALEQAADLKSRIDAGESFEDLAAEFSDDTGSAAYGGDVGYTTGDSFVEPFEEALRELEMDEVSDPVVSEFGVHLIKLTDLISGEFASLEESREDIRRELQLDGASELYQQKLQQLEVLAFETFDLELPAEELGLSIQTTEPFSRQGGTGLASDDRFVDAAFSIEVLEDGLNSDPVELDTETTAVLHLNEHILPEVRPLNEVRVQIELLLRQEKVREQARATGESILSSIQNDQNIDTMLEQLGITWENRPTLSRSSAVNPELLQWIFGLRIPEEGETVADGTLLSSGVYAVAELHGVTPGSIETIDEAELEALSAYVTQQTGIEDRASMLATLQTEAEIVRR